MCAVLLRTGERIRVRPVIGRSVCGDQIGHGAWSEGTVALASKNGKSVAVDLDEGAARTGDGGMFIGPLLLMVDYEQETVQDLRGGQWEIEVAGQQATYSPTD